MKPTSFSIIIEWENTKLSEMERARQMLEAVGRQARELDQARFTPLELILLYDPGEVDRQFLEDLLSETVGDDMPFHEVKLLPVEGMRYYEIKNYGATQTQADVIMFLDSDVIPEPGWMEQLLEAAEFEFVQVVAGSAYVEPQSLYEKAFAAFWFFPLRSEHDALEVTNGFFANNVMFKKSVFDAHPFPSNRRFRGQCTMLSQELRQQQVGMFVHWGARVSHPPPNGGRHFVARALCNGYDQVINNLDKSSWSLLRSAFGNLSNNLAAANGRMSERGASIGLNIGTRQVARGIALAYYVFSFLGECITMAAPQLVPRHFPI